jgi:hypothetical protein
MESGDILELKKTFLTNGDCFDEERAVLLVLRERLDRVVAELLK